MTDPKITLKDVEHVARLARLELGPDDKERMRRELDGILSYIDKLRAARHRRRRADLARRPDDERHARRRRAPSFPQSDMLANAPERSGDFFRVPKIIEE